MSGVIAALTDYPILTLFVVIGLGYLAGQVNLRGFRFGVVGVLFVGLAIGSLSPGIALPEVVPTLGLIIFVYTIGIQSGPAFFASFRKKGYRDGLLAVGVLLFGAALTFALAIPLGLSGPRAAGLYCGALTNTPALAAARETVRDRARAHGARAGTRGCSRQPAGGRLQPRVSGWRHRRAALVSDLPADLARGDETISRRAGRS